MKAPRGSELRKVGHQPLARPVNLDEYNDRQVEDRPFITRRSYTASKKVVRVSPPGAEP